MVRRGSLTGRRRWPSSFTALIGGLCILTVGSIAAAVAIYAWPPTPPRSEIIVQLGMPISTLPKGQAVRFIAPPGTAFVMVDGGGVNAAGNFAEVGWLVHGGSGLSAFAANSSDDGCLVIFDPAASLFMDPCHGAIYGLDGHVSHGPATAPLAHLGWRMVSADKIGVRGLAVIVPHS